MDKKSPDCQCTVYLGRRKFTHFCSFVVLGEIFLLGLIVVDFVIKLDSAVVDTVDVVLGTVLPPPVLVSLDVHAADEGGELGGPGMEMNFMSIFVLAFFAKAFVSAITAAMLNLHREVFLVGQVQSKT